MNRISAAEYRKQYIDPALAEQRADENFMKQLKEIDKKTKKKTSVKSLGRTEHEIQSNILERLSFLKEGFFWRENSGSFNLGTENNKRFFRAGIKGIADIMGVYKGMGVAIEVKRPSTKNNVSEHQKAFLRRFKECGGIAIVCWDDADVINLIDNAYKKKTHL